MSRTFRPFQRTFQCLMGESVNSSTGISRFWFSSALLVCVFLIQGPELARAGTVAQKNSNPAGVLGQYATTSSEATVSGEDSAPCWDSGKEPASYSPEDLNVAPKTLGDGAVASAPTAKPLLIP